MAGLGDNLRRWRDVAEVDWFSQFIKAWIPFNAWLTDTFGDVSDREMLDRLKGGPNAVRNKTLPMMSKSLRMVRDAVGGWQDDGPDAQEFRLHIGELHGRLQECIVVGRKGRIGFESVDLGSNSRKEETKARGLRKFSCHRDHPSKGEVSVTISATKTVAMFSLVLPTHDRRTLEDEPRFRNLTVDQRSILLSLFDSVAPRLVSSVIADPGSSSTLNYGEVHFTNDAERNFSALIDVIYGLRNALFHGSITPNEAHNNIYRPAYHIAMRLVRATL